MGNATANNVSDTHQIRINGNSGSRRSHHCYDSKMKHSKDRKSLKRTKKNKSKHSRNCVPSSPLPTSTVMTPTTPTMTATMTPTMNRGPLMVNVSDLQKIGRKKQKRNTLIANTTPISHPNLYKNSTRGGSCASNSASRARSRRVARTPSSMIRDDRDVSTSFPSVAASPLPLSPLQLPIDRQQNRERAKANLTTVQRPTTATVKSTATEPTKKLRETFQNRAQQLASLHGNVEDSPRCLFVSLHHLMTLWDTIPFNVLYDAIFLFNVKQRWIFPRHPSDLEEFQSQHPLGKHMVAKRISFHKLFLQMLIVKDKQHQVIWLPDNGTEESLSSRSQQSPANKIHPTWQHVSRQLTEIMDPVTGDFFKPLPLSHREWLPRSFGTLGEEAGLIYAKSLNQIYSELTLFNFEYKAVMEIFHKSNPTLIPMVIYDYTIHDTSTRLIEKLKARMPSALPSLSPMISPLHYNTVSGSFACNSPLPSLRDQSSNSTFGSVSSNLSSLGSVAGASSSAALPRARRLSITPNDSNNPTFNNWTMNSGTPVAMHTQNWISIITADISYINERRNCTLPTAMRSAQITIEGEDGWVYLCDSDDDSDNDDSNGDFDNNDDDYY